MAWAWPWVPWPTRCVANSAGSWVCHAVTHSVHGFSDIRTLFTTQVTRGLHDAVEAGASLLGDPCESHDALSCFALYSCMHARTYGCTLLMGTCIMPLPACHLGHAPLPRYMLLMGTEPVPVPLILAHSLPAAGPPQGIRPQDLGPGMPGNTPADREFWWVWLVVRLAIGFGLAGFDFACYLAAGLMRHT